MVVAENRLEVEEVAPGVNLIELQRHLDEAPRHRVQVLHAHREVVDRLPGLKKMDGRRRRGCFELRKARFYTKYQCIFFSKPHICVII